MTARGRVTAPGRATLGIAVAALLGACGDPKGSAPAASAGASASAAASASATGAVAAGATSAPAGASDPSGEIASGREEPIDPSAVAAEPERKTLQSAADDPALYANRDFVADHWGVVRLPFPLQLQAAPLPHARRALLLTGGGPALEKPLLLVVETDQKIAWSKPRPLVGTYERARELTISRGPRGEVLLFWYDETSKRFAMRMWDHGGGILADFELLGPGGCDAATVLFWPGHGWVIAVIDTGTLHAQLLGETGTLRWTRNGVEVPWPTATAHAAAGQRPGIAIQGETIEITLRPRRVRLSLDGALVK